MTCVCVLCAYSVLCLWCVVGLFLFFKSLSYCCMFVVFVHLRLQCNFCTLRSINCSTALSLCTGCMYVLTVKCKWSVDIDWLFQKQMCRKFLKYVWICVQGYAFFNPLTGLFIVTSFYALKYVVTHCIWSFLSWSALRDMLGSYWWWKCNNSICSSLRKCVKLVEFFYTTV